MNIKKTNTEALLLQNPQTNELVLVNHHDGTMESKRNAVFSMVRELDIKEHPNVDLKKIIENMSLIELGFSELSEDLQKIISEDYSDITVNSFVILRYFVEHPNGTITPVPIEDLGLETNTKTSGDLNNN
jgi:hypothetical protein